MLRTIQTVAQQIKNANFKTKVFWELDENIDNV